MGHGELSLSRKERRRDKLFPGHGGGFVGSSQPSGVGKEDLTSQEMSVEQEMEQGMEVVDFCRELSMEPDPLLSHISYGNFTKNTNLSVL